MLFKSKNNKIFGGCTLLTWDGKDIYKENDEKAFLFSIDNNLIHQIKKLNKVIYCHPSYGPTFGGCADIFISSNFNYNSSSYSSFRASY